MLPARALNTKTLRHKHFTYKDLSLKQKNGESYTMQNSNNEKAGGTILISDTIYFKIENVSRDKEGYLIIIITKLKRIN